MATKRDEASQTSPTVSDQGSKGSLKLLLHTVDGAIPYLTPHLLEKCFPAEKVKDILWIGLAVRDTCISPIIAPPPLPSNSDNKGSKKKNGAQAIRIKPNGYTFSSTITPDKWLLPYTRVSVPTFDPFLDARQFSPKKVADDTTLTASNNHVMVWTDNGRQKLSKELYDAAVLGLKSQASVPLFDACSLEATTRRRRASLQRTNIWCGENIKQQTENGKKDGGDLWAPCLISPPPSEDGREDPEVEEQFQSLKKALNEKSISGVAFVNCQSISESASQHESLLQRSIQRLEVGPDSSSELLVLTTNSLEHFMASFHLGIGIIGTNLPAKWAKEKKAFVCDFLNWKKHEQKRPRVETSPFSPGSLDNDCCFPVLSGSAVDGKGGAWIRDDGPLLPGCSCLACRQHCRAYIYHLVMTKELLADILLFIHNLHHMIALCRELAQSRVDGNDEELFQHIQNQIKHASDT